MPIKKEKKDVVAPTENSVFEESHNTSLFEEVNEEAVVETKPVVEEKETSLPLSLVQKMMKEMEEKLMNKFSNQLEKLKTKKAVEQLDEDLAYVAELEEDWLDIPVVFFAFSFNFSIHGDKKRGIEEEPPGGAVKFQPLIRTKRRGQKGIQVISVSSVKVQSKQLMNYLRSHSQFGIAFYESVGSVMSVDATWAQKMVEAQQSITRLSDIQVIARAKQEGISVSQSPESMRRQLVENMAKRSIDQQDKMLYGNLRNSVLDKDGRSITEKTIG
jgi:hypothetical protein